MFEGSVNFQGVFGQLIFRFGQFSENFGQLLKNFGQLFEIFGQKRKIFGHLEPNKVKVSPTINQLSIHP